ncbi:MAG: hypothetical protein K0R97_684 [Oerskovia sp.]|jgi:hypothetical protein|nr:hypothetical protein [Oerskovia sp.]
MRYVDEEIRTYETTVRNVVDTAKDLVERSPSAGSRAERDAHASALLNPVLRLRVFSRTASRSVRAAHKLVLAEPGALAPEAFILHRTALLAACKAVVLLAGATPAERLTTSATLLDYDLQNRRTQINEFADFSEEITDVRAMSQELSRETAILRRSLDEEIARLGLRTTRVVETRIVKSALTIIQRRAATNAIMIGLGLWRHASGYAHASPWPDDRWGEGTDIPPEWAVREHTGHAAVILNLLMSALVRADALCTVTRAGEAFRRPLA